MIVQRQCYTKLLGQMQMWAKDIVSGTPGIGKTTLIYFLLWKFFQKELDYDVVVLGTPSGLISIHKDGRCQNHQTGHLPMLQRSLGLFDIAPSGTVKTGLECLNNQEANTFFRVYHILLVAMPGFDIPTPLTCFFWGGDPKCKLHFWGDLGGP